MKVAAAQIIPFDTNIEENIEKHKQWILNAASKGVELILFPEMSLTGYQREQAKSLSFYETDDRLEPLQELSNDNGICIIAGAPISLNAKLYIGAYIIQPNQLSKIYLKQFLHDGEEKYFDRGLDPYLTNNINNRNSAIAICADITNPKHAEKAHQNGASLYLASLFYTPNGISDAYTKLSDYAKKYKMNILMSNYAGESYNIKSAGSSGFWNTQGELTDQLNSFEEGLLVVEI